MSQPQGLAVTAREWRTISRILAKVLPDVEVWAFGSRVTGKATKFSDLDLAVVLDQGLDLETRGKLEEALSESTLPFQVDIVDIQVATPGFRAVVEREHLVIQKVGATISGRRP